MFYSSYNVLQLENVLNLKVYMTLYQYDNKFSSKWSTDLPNIGIAEFITHKVII